MQDLKLKEYLEESDTDFDDFKSVQSDRVAQYSQVYKIKTRGAYQNQAEIEKINQKSSERSSMGTSGRRTSVVNNGQLYKG